MKPNVQIIPARPLPLLPETTDVLVRITPAMDDTASPRSPLDLALVLDSSGSMKGLPLQLAKDATLLIGQALSPDDRLALVTFASTPTVLFPLQEIGLSRPLERHLDPVQAGGSTALHGGWQLGAALLQGALHPGRLPRVVLLTDGRANVGLCHPKAIAADVTRSLAQGISTSTVGVGLRYDEHLLEEVAGAGDGNYHFAETPGALADIFSSELESLRATVGRLASLGVKGVQLLDVLNDLPKLPTGRQALPPLRAGRALDLILRVKAKAGDTLTLRLAWTDAAGQRHTAHVSAVLPTAQPGTLPTEDPEVVRVRAGLVAARAQREIAQLTDAGQLDLALTTLNHSRQRLHQTVSIGIQLDAELATLEGLDRRLRQGDRQGVSKAARSAAYNKTTGRDRK